MDFSDTDLERHIQEYKKLMDGLFEKTLGEQGTVHATKQHAIAQRIVNNLVTLKMARKKEKDSTF